MGHLRREMPHPAVVSYHIHTTISRLLHARKPNSLLGTLLLQRANYCAKYHSCGSTTAHNTADPSVPIPWLQLGSLDMTYYERLSLVLAQSPYIVRL